MRHWSALHLLPSQGAISRKMISSINRKEIIWLPPPRSKYKLNFDSSSHGNPSKSIIGVVVTDDGSKFIRARCQCIPDGTNNVVEIHALSVGLDMLILLDFKDVVIEGDSMVVFYVVTNRACNSWHLQYCVDKIFLQLKLFNSYSISHCYREVNFIAYFLANKALNENIQILEDIDEGFLPPLPMKS
ncbi:uncharacterized protein LOC131048003 [Cryptomeria japonica]|uniref:uncharacterized protein LOC131048003 n=1 Tax=Cryptomeria japonica TaxID=3369 RepID=UPI0027D9DE3E|nr:uncharacterized protein LOC131048003 [Cryptomeria japonica]